MRLKRGVTLAGIRPELVVGMVAAQAAYAGHGYEFVVTSVTDSTHSRTSLHYSGQAFDCRTRHVPDDRLEHIVIDLKALIPTDFDVILESDHIHVEWQPKR